MKHTKTIIAVFLIFLICLGFVSVLFNTEEQTQALEYDNTLQLAEDYMTRGLYQLAIGEYESAIQINDSKELRDLLLLAYESRYAESSKILSDFIAAAQSSNSQYPDVPGYYVLLARLHVANGDYQSAYDVLCKAELNEIADESVTNYLTEIRYAFDVKWNTYESISSLTNGAYAVMDSGLWGHVDEEGSNVHGCNHIFLSGVGQEGIYVLVDDQAILEDSDEIIRGKLDFIPSWSGIYAEGLIALKNGEKIGFYNSLGDYAFGEFLNAGSFKNGKAAVSDVPESWYLIDSQGKRTSTRAYQDIKLGIDDACLMEGIMLGKVDGVYRIYDATETPVGDFSCDNVDIVLQDGLIAYEEDGSWGFVDTTGKVIIAPAFDGAKSFSNGLAAVCMNGKWGFIDTSGSVVIECQFVNADYFNTHGNCFVQTSETTWQMISLKVKT